MGKWFMIAALLGLLVVSLWIAYDEWNLVAVDVPVWAWFAMAGGAFFSILVGGGLMTLIFYSSRKGYDEPPHSFTPDDPG